MATAINISDITSNVVTTGTGQSTTVTGNGYFDDLMESVNTHLKAQFDAGRMTGDTYGQVYSQMVQAVLQQSMQFALNKAQAEQQSDLISKQIEVAEQERLAKKFEVDNILPEQLTKIQEEVDLLQTQDSELGFNGIADRALKEKQLEIAEQERLAKAYEVTYIQPEQLAKIQEEIDLLQTQDSEMLLNGAKQRDNLTSQIALTDERTKTQLQQTNEAESRANIAEDMEYVSSYTKQDKIDMSGYDKSIKNAESQIALGTITNKIAMSGQQLAKLTAEASYIDEQETQLINSVNFNNKIKALDSLADTYGTFGAGGLDVTADMWNTYFSIVSDLSTATVPTSVGASKVI